MRSKQKKGLFMSVELIVVIIIITAIVAIVAAGVFYLISTKRKADIIREQRVIIEAVDTFSITYNTLPGLLRKSSLGGPFNNTVLIADYTILETAGAVGSVVTEDIGQALAWKELAAHDKTSIPSAIDLSGTVTPTAGSCVSYNTLITNNVVPKANFDNNLAWILTSSNAHKGVISNTNRTAAWPNTKLRLVLVRYSGLTAAECLNIDSGAQKLGALSANDTYNIMSKISFSDPSSSSSMVAENNGVSGGCTTLTTAGSSASATDLSGSKFISSDDNSGSNGCIMHFAASR